MIDYDRRVKRLALLPLLVLLAGAPPDPEARLAQTWRTLHPGEPMPATCGEGDRARAVAFGARTRGVAVTLS